MDTYIVLYDTDGTTVLASNDDWDPGTVASRIVWTAPADGTYYVKIQYEDEDGIGRYDISIDIESVPADSYEIDDTYQQATLIATTGELQSHTFHDRNEPDYVKFQTTRGNAYTIETSNLSSCPEAMDTEIWLYDTDGTTELAHDDEGGVGHASKIVWTARANGTYYVKIRGYEDEIGWYDISVSPFVPLVFRVERSTGDVFARSSFIPGGADIAERINVSERVEPGDVVELDPTKPGHYRKARGSSHLIAGVITTKPGFTLGNRPEELEPTTGIAAENPLMLAAAGRPLLALMGRVPVKATTENGPIRPGDLLTISSKAGYAMRCADSKACDGAIIGKALEALERGEGLILVLLMSH